MLGATCCPAIWVGDPVGGWEVGGPGSSLGGVLTAPVYPPGTGEGLAGGCVAATANTKMKNRM